jgi:hypothetical protein
MCHATPGERFVRRVLAASHSHKPEKTMNRFLASTLMLVALAVLTTPVHAVDRPYKSSGTAEFTSPTGDFVGSSNATHLGNYTEVGNAVILPTGAVTAWSIYTAANGSKLYAIFVSVRS